MTPRTLERGDLVVVDLGVVTGMEQAGIRPAVVLSNTLFNRAIPLITVAPLTSYKGGRFYASEVLVRRGDGKLTRDSLILVHQMRTLSVKRVQRRLGSLEQAAMNRVDDAVRTHLYL